MSAAAPSKPNVGDILVVIHDFQARSSDELTLHKGDRVELTERDDEFGDGWFLGRHLVNGNSGLFPEVYTRPAPKNIPQSTPTVTPSKPPPTKEITQDARPASPIASAVPNNLDSTITAASPPAATTPVTLPLQASKSLTATHSPSLVSSFASPPAPATNLGNLGHANSSQDSHVLHETLNVINEHITDLRSPQGNGLRNGGDSGSDYSAPLDSRLSYIQGEETDEEEEEGGALTRSEVETWSVEDVAEYLFTSGVEKHHCEVFREQDITGEVLLEMDQTSIFIKAFDLGSVGRRLKTWQKIKALQDEVNGLVGTRRNTQSYGSEAGSDATRTRSRTNTMTNSVSRLGSVQIKRGSVTPSLKMESGQANASSPPGDGANRPRHDKRPSAASVRDLHHSRRHSSTDFRPQGPTANPAVTPKLSTSGTFPQTEVAHRKQPSFDRNWTLGSATATAPAYAPRPLSSTGFQDMEVPGQVMQDSAVDLDRGYFSGPDVDGKRRNVLKKRDSVQGHAHKSSYTEEQRIRSATALSRHSRVGSIDSVNREPSSPAAQKYYGFGSRRTASSATANSIRPVPENEPGFSPITKMDSGSMYSGSSKQTAMKRLSQVNHPDFNMNILLKGSLRAASDAIVSSTDRSKMVTSPVDASLKDSSAYSPSRTGSSTPSAGPSFELDSPDATKSPSTTATAASRKSAKAKTKKETSAYTRGLQKITPREAIAGADYSGWMKKKSSNLMTTWKPRLFVLKGRRLAYYYSEDDQEEKGLIDISFHRVLPADNERLTSLHATLTGASNTPTAPAESSVQTLAETDAGRDPIPESDAMFIFKLVPPRAGLSRAVTFTKPTVHYFAVPNLKQGRLWMAALMKATIDRDDSQAITTTYQQKTISLAKARQMRHRPPALMNLDEDDEKTGNKEHGKGGLGIVYNEGDSGVSGVEKMGMHQAESARSRGFSFATGEGEKSLPQSA